MSAEDVSLAELLTALSVATDLGMGQEPEKAVRACLVATALARELDLPERQVHDVYYCTLLQHLGCTAPAHELTRLLGDDLTSSAQAERSDSRSRREMAALMALVGRGTGAARPVHVARMLATGDDGLRPILRSVCEVGARLAHRLGLGPGVQLAVYAALEGWDGSDGPLRLAGEDIPVAARVSVVATQAVIFDRLGGPSAAEDMVRRRAGGWFDPDVAAAFLRVGARCLRRLGEADVWAEVAAAEPAPQRRVPPTRLDAVAAAFGDLADLKTPFTLGHSPGVATLAAAAAVQLNLADDAVGRLRRAGLLHDLGRVAVPDAVWERPRPLTTGQWEQVRLHAYHSERILARSAVLAPLGRLAGRHHERQDGSGYHRGAAGGEIPVEARVLAAADVLQALTQPRPHRPAMPADQAAHVVAGMTEAGTLDPESAAAVIAAAGQPRPPRPAWPAGLSDREVQVLRLIARGRSNREIAAELVVSPRTAEHHVQHIYGKIGVSTRPAAALFAVEHGLLH